MYTMPRIAAAVSTVGVLIILGPEPAWGQCVADELDSFTSPDETGFFGARIAFDDGTAVIGAPGDYETDVNAGAAYVFHFDGATWTHKQKLLADDGAFNDIFGGSVSISGDTIVVGARRDDDNGNNSGSAYVFRLEGSIWTQEQKLLPDDGDFSDYFGIAVAVSGDVAVIGAYFDGDEPGITAGSAYVFRYNGLSWLQEQKLVPDDPTAPSKFGIAVATTGDVIVVGAYTDDDNGPFSGSAYVFRHDGSSWVLEQKLLSADGASLDGFGFAVAISDDAPQRAVIGAFRHPHIAIQAGSAYVFRFDGSMWFQEQELLPSDGDANAYFGWAVGIVGETAVVGSPYDNNENGAEAGSAYAFRYDGNNWIEQARMLSSDQGRRQFGWSLSVSGDAAIITGYDDPAIVYDFRGLSDCNENTSVDICDIVDGTSQDGNRNGTPDECECPADLDGDGIVGAFDLAMLLGGWGPCPGCPADINSDDVVNAADLAMLLGTWGPCP